MCVCVYNSDSNGGDWVKKIRFVSFVSKTRQKETEKVIGL